MHTPSTKLHALIFATIFAVAAMTTAAAAQREKPLNSDFALFNPAKGVWYTTSADGCAFTGVRWGSASDVPVPADYDGDGEKDAAVWRPDSGTWLIRRSSDKKAQIIRFGMAKADSMGFEDEPVPADYDGDGVAEIALWRPTTGEWLTFAGGKTLGLAKSKVMTLGSIGDTPVPADYDGDGKTDLAVFRDSENRWSILQSSDGQLRIEKFGNAGDVLVPADYTGDRKADPAVFRSGTWYVLSSETQQIEPFVFGFADSIAVPGDYDGDGTADFAVFRKGTWYIYDSGKPRFHTFEFGNEKDIPLNSLVTRKSFSP